MKSSNNKSRKIAGKRGFRSALFKALLFIGLLLVASHFNVAAANLFHYHDSDGVAASGTASPAFIPGISPVYDFYSYWDTSSLDPYCFDFSKITGSINLQVLDADCGFALPVIGAMSSPFGWRWGQVHAGVDLHLKIGDSVVSAFDGVVRMSKWYGGYGNCVVVRHHNGLETLYGHLSKRLVQPGDLVNAGQVIGLGGSTGYSTGPHLHFETRIMGKAFNPQMLIDFKKDSLLKDTLTFTSTSFTAPAAPVYRYHYRGYRKSSAYRRRR